MHIDLIPAYEMITGGDPTWGSEVASESPAQLGLAGQGNNRLLRSPSGVGANTGLLHASPTSDPMGNSPAAAGPLYPGTPGRGQQLPDTMAGWKDLVDGMTRHERDKLWPGMHKDLIPATEMI